MAIKCVIKNGVKVWSENGVTHRHDGPAIEFPNGAEIWYYRGVSPLSNRHPFNEFRAKYDLPKDITTWPTELRVLFELTWM